MKILLRCLGVERVALITDAMVRAYRTAPITWSARPSMRKRPGDPFGWNPGWEHSTDEPVRSEYQPIRRVPLAEAVKMATLVPAQAMGFADRLGSLHTGREANLTVIDQNVRLTFVRGKVVYANL